MQKKDRRGAARELRLVVEQKPDLLNAHNALGTILHELGDLETASADFKAALKIDPRSVYALHNLGQSNLTVTKVFEV